MRQLKTASGVATDAEVCSELGNTLFLVTFRKVSLQLCRLFLSLSFVEAFFDCAIIAAF